MKRTAISLAIAAGLAMNAQAGVVKTEGEDIIISTKKGGFSAKTADGSSSFKLSGKLQWDYQNSDDLFTNGNFGKAENTGFVRRAELKVSGKAYTVFGYGLKLKLDTDGDTKLDNAYIDYKGFKPVSIRVGKWGRDFGLENTTSSSWITGIERPFIYDVMRGDETNKYGIEAAVYEKQYTVVAGLHNDGQHEENNDANKELGLTFRATAAPIIEDNMLVHVGFNYQNSNPDKAEAEEVKTNLGVKKSDGWDVVNTAGIKASDDSEIVLEGAAQFGSLQLQGEYFMRTIEQKDAANAKADVDLNGYYVQASYMVDGGKRSYKEGAFGKPMGGQWEVFARMTQMEIDAKGSANKGLNGKDIELDSVTVGVNYFPTKNVRASLNYVTADTSNLVAKTAVNKKSDDGTAIVGRLQYAF